MKPLAPHERTVVHVLRRALEHFPDRPWIVGDGGSATYGELDATSNRIANGMAAHGFSVGDTVLFMLPDVIEFVGCWAACSKAGVVEVPVNTAYRGDILSHVVNDSRAKAMVIGVEFLDRLDAVAQQLVHLERVYVLQADDTPKGSQPALDARCELLPFEALMSDDPTAPDHEPAVSDLKAIMYTSGTTGPSKGVMVSQAHAFEYANGAAMTLDIGPGDVYYTAGLPLFHVAGKWGVVYAVAQQGATAAVPRRFSAAAFWPDVRKWNATSTFLLGAMANFLQRQPADKNDADTPLEKVLMCPLLPDVADFASRFGCQVATAYGSTEVNAPIFMALGTPVTDPQMVGPVRADTFEAKVFDENDAEVPPGALGEIVVRPREPWVTMMGYWHQPEQTVAMWRNQWLHSGDAGRYDEDGTFYFVDRIKDAIRRRGENISSMEVEAIVGQHPAIAECAVFPVASEFSEQEVAVAVALKPGTELDPVDLITFLEPRMAYFMVPRYVVFEDALPKTPTGKVQKFELRERGVTDMTWDREAVGMKLAR